MIGSPYPPLIFLHVGYWICVAGGILTFLEWVVRVATKIRRRRP